MRGVVPRRKVNVPLENGRCEGFTHSVNIYWVLNMCMHFFFFVFCLYRAAPTAHGGSQARGLTRAAGVGLHHSSQQHQILNPLGGARDGTRNLKVPNQICVRCATTGTPL